MHRGLEVTIDRADRDSDALLLKLSALLADSNADDAGPGPDAENLAQFESRLVAFLELLVGCVRSGRKLSRALESAAVLWAYHSLRRFDSLASGAAASALVLHLFTSSPEARRLIVGPFDEPSGMLGTMPLPVGAVQMDETLLACWAQCYEAMTAAMRAGRGPPLTIVGFIGHHHPTVERDRLLKDFTTDDALARALRAAIERPNDAALNAMCEVRHSAGRSDKLEHGLFARESLPPCHLLGIYGGWVTTEERFDALVPLVDRAFVERYAITTRGRPAGSNAPLMVCAHGTEASALRYLNDAAGPADSRSMPRAATVALLEIQYCGWLYVAVVSSVHVDAGDELLADYGKEYWAAQARADLAHLRLKEALDRLM